MRKISLLLYFCISFLLVNTNLYTVCSMCFLQNDYDIAYTKKDSPRTLARQQDPDQMVYAELGAGGGRTGPKPTPAPSNYAEVKVDDMGYPARGPTSDRPVAPTYAAVDKSRRNSPPPPNDDDFNEGVIV